MGRKLICKQRLTAPLIINRCRSTITSSISPALARLSQIYRQIVYVLLTRSPLSTRLPPHHARLACIRHAASVRSEPGSNSPYIKSRLARIYLWLVMRAGRLGIVPYSTNHWLFANVLPFAFLQKNVQRTRITHQCFQRAGILGVLRTGINIT